MLKCVILLVIPLSYWSLFLVFTGARILSSCTQDKVLVDCGSTISRIMRSWPCSARLWCKIVFRSTKYVLCSILILTMKGANSWTLSISIQTRWYSSRAFCLHPGVLGLTHRSGCKRFALIPWLFQIYGRVDNISFTASSSGLIIKKFVTLTSCDSSVKLAARESIYSFGLFKLHSGKDLVTVFD